MKPIEQESVNNC